jgi:hypothetical protein
MIAPNFHLEPDGRPKFSIEGLAKSFYIFGRVCQDLNVRNSTRTIIILRPERVATTIDLKKQKRHQKMVEVAVAAAARSIRGQSEDIATQANNYVVRIGKTIVANEMKPFSAAEFAQATSSVDCVFQCVKTAVDTRGETILRGDLDNLFRQQEYREELTGFVDFIIVIVDTIAESEIEVFDVKGCTKILQEMLRTYIPNLGNRFQFECTNHFISTGI